MELLYGVGFAILALLAWRVVQWFRDYQRKLRIRLEPVPPGPDVEVTSFPELGKVRVRPRDEAADTMERDKWDSAPTLGPAPIAPATPLRAAAREAESATPAASEDDQMPVLLNPVPQPEGKLLEQQDMFADETIAPPPFPRKEPSRRVQALYETPVDPVRPVITASDEKPFADVQDVIALHVVARQQPFNGEDLLRCILSYGLRYGEMSIFHRHEQPTGQGRILFSMAKAVEPGTFDLEAMTGEEVPGVSFFLSLPGVTSILAYDIMVDTAKRLATELQGEILDEQQQSLTRQLVEHYRERVQEFERRRLMQRPSA
jgi:cell division protein ZipA